ncbi:hypothetical protein HDG36_002634 [Paraburkholderia sp. Kb1A]|nr:hypothetical protein [Paraburkholderia sp. Kb1A]
MAIYRLLMFLRQCFDARQPRIIAAIRTFSSFSSARI